MRQTSMKLKYFTGWLPLVVIAFVNGTIRQVGFQKSLGDLHAHQLSTAIGITLFGIYIFWIIRRWKLESQSEAIKIGMFWMILTIAFEFALGRFILGREWSVLLNDYNLLEGRVWILVLLWVAISPLLFYKLHKTS